MTVTIEIPARTGGSPPSVVVPATGNGGAVDLSFPRNVGPQGPAGTRSTDIGLTWPGLVPDEIGTFPVTKTTTITQALCLAEATGTGVVSFDLDSTPIGSVTFPGATFNIVQPAISRGFLSFTSTGALSDLSLALAGER